MNRHLRNALLMVLLLAVGLFVSWFIMDRQLDHQPGFTFPKLPRPHATPKPIPPIALPPLTNRAFAAGEKLFYDVIFKGVAVGHATFEVAAGPKEFEAPTLRFTMTSESTPFFDSFLKVRDKTVSLVDKASLASIEFDQELNEGPYEGQRHYKFDYGDRTFSATEKTKDKTTSRHGALKEPVYDLLSALYWVRARHPKPGDELHVLLFRDKVGRKFSIKVHDEPMELKTVLGKVWCLGVEPTLKHEPLFESPEHKLVVWMADDGNFTPVLIEATTKYGLIRAKLAQPEEKKEKPTRS